MAELTLLDERLISGKGVLKVPAGAFQDRYYILYLDVIRRPKNEYRSFEWNPPRSVYARLVYRKDGYVQSEDVMRYQREERTYVNDISGQNLRAIKCAYEGILISFDRQNAALGLIPLPYDNLILEYKSLSLGWDEVLFQCYADTAIQCRFYSLDYDTCNPANDQTDLPPPPPPPLSPVPPGTGIGDISPPYDGENDDGNTVPFEGDNSPPPPVLRNWEIRSKGLLADCSPNLSSLFITTVTAFEVGFETRTVPSGSFEGCSFDYLVVDGVSRYPDISGGSAPGTGEIIDLGPA